MGDKGGRKCKAAKQQMGNGNGSGHAGHGRGMSIVDVQRYAKELHVQGFHLLSEGGLVLRTQALFEHR